MFYQHAWLRARCYLGMKYNHSGAEFELQKSYIDTQRRNGKRCRELPSSKFFTTVNHIINKVKSEDLNQILQYIMMEIDQTRDTV